MEMEGFAASRDHGNGRLMQINKIYSAKTLARVALELGEDEDWLDEIASEMEPEDGVIRIYGVDEDDCTMVFSDYGVEILQTFIENHRENEKLFGPRSLT